MIAKINKSLLTQFNNPFNAPVLFRDSVVSTMDEAHWALSEGYGHGTICIAGHQSGGRGRVPGRVWDDESGVNLLMTILLSMEKVSTAGLPLTLKGALSLIRTLSDFGVHAQVKWPNDLYLEQKKISGILCVVSDQMASMGIGINVNQSSFSADLTRKAGSLLTITGREWDLSELFNSFLGNLNRILPERDGAEELSRFLMGRDELVHVLIGDPRDEKRLEGRIQGLAYDGSLVFLEQGEINPVSIYSGEVDYSPFM